MKRALVSALIRQKISGIGITAFCSPRVHAIETVATIPAVSEILDRVAVANGLTRAGRLHIWNIQQTKCAEIAAMKHERTRKSSGGFIAAVTPNSATAPAVHPRAVTDPNIIDQGHLFNEALRQTRPIAAPGSREAAQAAKEIGKVTARPNGMHLETCERIVTEGRSLGSLFSGRHPSGTASEVVAAADYLDLHAGGNPGITNGPQRTADNIQDIRLSPDTASRKDLLFSFRTKDGMVIFKANGQVKTGNAQYVSDKLVKMAETPGYGKVGYVDARYVNTDGTPRVAPDGFTEAQARRIQGAKVRLRGIKDLEARAKQLVENVNKHRQDGLDPVARQQLQQLRDDIALAYQPGKVATRMAGGAATAAAMAAVVTLVMQLANDGKIDLATVGDAAGQGALLGAGGALADAGIFHAATQFGMLPEVAKSVAQNGVAAGFCLLAVSVDVLHEIKSVRGGEVTTANAVAGTASKVALDVLPLVVAHLGIAGIPILVGAQLGGRWMINRLREADRKLEHEVEEDLRETDQLHIRLDRMDQQIEAIHHDIEAIHRESEETDALFEEIFACEQSAPLRVVK